MFKVRLEAKSDGSARPAAPT